jgi:hypothetical protein
VPAHAEAELPMSASGRPLRIAVMLAGIALLVAGGVAVGFALRKPAEKGSEQARIDPPSTTLPAPIANPPVAKPQAAWPAKPQAAAPEIAPQPHLPNVAQAANTTPPQTFPTSQPTPQPTGPERAPPPRLVVYKPDPPKFYDRFGNPIGDYGLGRDGEFKGKKLLFWSGFEGAGRVFFGSTNPLWKALESQGFVVRREFGRFKPEWLKDVDQLWILSTGKMELPQGITPDLLELAVQFLPPEAIPSGFTLDEYRFIVRATLDCALSPMHPIDDKGFKAIEEFVKAGKGLCLLADDEPFCFEANEMAKRLYGVGVSGNYVADKVAFVKGHGLTAVDVRRFGGQFEVADHALLTGVNFLFEGITISNVGASDKLEVAMKASDGKALIVVSKVPGQRVVIDCGFTRYCHGPDPRVSYIVKTPGTVRLGQNIAAYLAGKDEVKKP